MLNGHAAVARQFALDLFERRLPAAGLRQGAGAALFAPLAMLVGALGLLAVWTLSAPGRPALTDALVPGALAPAGPTDLAPSTTAAGQAASVVSAAQAQDAALAAVLTGLGAPVDAQASAPVLRLADPMQTLMALKGGEAQMVAAADTYAHGRAERLARVFRGAGVDPAGLGADAATPAGPLSPLELKTPRVLAARFDIDAPLARRVQRAARSLIALHAMEQAVSVLPFALPVVDPVKSSGFGERTDPFTGQQAFHPGQDFAGRLGQDIHVTAPGVVAFAGPRSGYGECIEVEHGHGFKTRYGHLSAIDVTAGQAVAAGQVIGQMGSTGRSTGVHLHYEVWSNGVLQDPARFLKAGQDLQQSLGLTLAWTPPPGASPAASTQPAPIAAPRRIAVASAGRRRANGRIDVRFHA